MTEHKPGLQELLALLPSDGRERVVALYLDLLGPRLAAVEALLHDDPAQAVPLLHRVAGGAAMLQDHPVAKLARAMELAILEGDADQAIASWPALQVAAVRSRQALQDDAAP